MTIKSFMESHAFLEAARRQLAELHSRCAEGNVTVGARKVITVGGQKVVGFSVRVSGLSDEASLALQERGIGGRRKMGCGVFRKSDHHLAADARPARKEAAA